MAITTAVLVLKLDFVSKSPKRPIATQIAHPWNFLFKRSRVGEPINCISNKFPADTDADADAHADADLGIMF